MTEERRGEEIRQSWWALSPFERMCMKAGFASSGVVAFLAFVVPPILVVVR